MRDLTKITSKELAETALEETRRAIEDGKEAISKGAKTPTVEMLDELERELAEIEDLKRSNNW